MEFKDLVDRLSSYFTTAEEFEGLQKEQLDMRITLEVFLTKLEALTSRVSDLTSSVTWLVRLALGAMVLAVIDMVLRGGV